MSANDKDLKSYLETKIRQIINRDEILKLQFALLEKTAHSLSTETHIKGGFCRDILLTILSREARKISSNTRLFSKDIKDIDVAINTDPEHFGRTLFKIAKTEFGLEPIDVWNNGAKTDKGRNISVWSVKLLKGVEPLEIVHFRADAYDPKTGRVDITDVSDSFSDDFRRDIPWPSLRINDFQLVDYFGVLEMLNSGDLIITTPPIRVADGKFHPKFNVMIHHAQVERILRMFKFISPPYNSDFAYDFDKTNQRFRSIIHKGFELDPDIVEFYTKADSELYSENEVRYSLRNEIYENLESWRNNRLLSNVFKAIESAVSKRPYEFIKFLIDFKILDILFDSNHEHDILLHKTEILEEALISTNKRLSNPYMILGYGNTNHNSLAKVMDLFSIDKKTIRLSGVAQRDTVLNKNSDSAEQEILSELYTSSTSSYEAELREYYSIIGDTIGCRIDDIDPHKIEEYFDRRRKEKILKPILVDYMVVLKLSEKSLLSGAQVEDIRSLLTESLKCRVNGIHYNRYPNILKIVSDSYVSNEKPKTKNQKIRDTIQDLRNESTEIIESEDDIIEYANYEFPTLCNNTL